jgi:hypothetical protein
MRGRRVDGAHQNLKTLPAAVADCGGGSRAAWGSRGEFSRQRG